MKATNIKWDIDSEEDLDTLQMLPDEIRIPNGIKDEEEISDYISSVTGFCHKGFTLKEENMDKSNKMSIMEMESLTNTIRGMSEEQLKVVVSNIPIRIMCDEIANRYEYLVDKVNGVINIVGGI